jgi:hypothetical protein
LSSPGRSAVPSDDSGNVRADILAIFWLFEMVLESLKEMDKY